MEVEGLDGAKKDGAQMTETWYFPEGVETDLNFGCKDSKIYQYAQIGMRMVNDGALFGSMRGTTSLGQRQLQHLNFCGSFAETSERALEILNATKSVISEKPSTVRFRTGYISHSILQPLEYFEA